MYLEYTACLVVFCTSLTEAADFTQAQLSGLTRVISDMMLCRNIPGVSIAIVREGATDHMQAFGMQDVATPAAMQTSTVLCQSDLTQGFTATLAAIAISEQNGSIDWDAPLRNILGPKFTMQDEARTQWASLRDVLAHRLGISYHRGVVVAGVKLNTKDFAMGNIRHVSEAHKFRSKFEFSTYDYLLAAHAIEKMRAQTWENDVNDLFRKIGNHGREESKLLPLFIGLFGMQDTKLGTEIRNSNWGNGVARSYFYDTTNRRHVSNNDGRFLTMTNWRCPSACVWSSARDMAKWMAFHIRADGKDKNGRMLVKPEALKELYEPAIAAPWETLAIERPRFPVDDMFDTFGMGFQIGTYRGYLKLAQRGFSMNYHCTMVLLPEVKGGAWVCTNGPGRTTEIADPSAIIVRYALDLILQETPFLNETTACSFPMPWAPIGTAAANDPRGSDPPLQKAVVTAGSLPACWRLKTENYVGFYRHGAFGNISVRLTYNGELHYKYGEMLEGSLVISVAPDNFLMTFEAPFKDVYPDDRYTFSFLAQCCVDISSVKVDFLGYPAAPVFKKLSDNPAGPPVTPTPTPKVWPTRISDRGHQTVASSGGTLLSAAVATVYCWPYLRQ